MTEDPFRSQSKDIHRLRSEVEDEIRGKLRGFYFPPSGSLLENRLQDSLILELCPGNARSNAAEAAAKYTWRALMHCNNSWTTLQSHGTTSFWTRVASQCEKPETHIRLQPPTLRDYVVALLRARQRYIVRQSTKISDFDKLNDLNDDCDCLGQRLLNKVETLEDPVTFSGDVFWNPLLTEKEKETVREDVVVLGPTKQISSKRFQLSSNCAQKLYPIAELSRGRSRSNSLGFADALIQHTSPREPPKVIMSPQIAINRAVENHSSDRLACGSKSVDQSTKRTAQQTPTRQNSTPPQPQSTPTKERTQWISSIASRKRRQSLNHQPPRTPTKPQRFAGEKPGDTISGASKKGSHLNVSATDEPRRATGVQYPPARDLPSLLTPPPLPVRLPSHCASQIVSGLDSNRKRSEPASPTASLDARREIKRRGSIGAQKAHRALEGILRLSSSSGAKKSENC